MLVKNSEQLSFTTLISKPFHSWILFLDTYHWRTLKFHFLHLYGVYRGFVLVSALFPEEEEETLSETLLIEYCNRKHLLVISCDANAHHTAWGSCDVNVRVVYLIDYLWSENINVVNRGTEPIFRNLITEEVLDLIIKDANICIHIRNWFVSKKPSISDHANMIWYVTDRDLYCKN